MRGYSFLFWFLSLLFSLRVIGQAVQHWLPQPFLPPFDDFQGSSLGYAQLLSAQLLILALMVRTAWRASAGTLAADRRIGIALAWFGGIYMAGSLLRIAVGLIVPDAAAWFRTWIPAFFHLVLAGFVLTLSMFNVKFATINATTKECSE